MNARDDDGASLPALHWQRVAHAGWPGLAPQLHAWNRRADGRVRCLHSDQGPDAAAYAAELAALAEGEAAFWRCGDAAGGATLGVIGCEVDPVARRAWLRGPLAATPAVLQAMQAQALPQMTAALPTVTQWDAFVAADDAPLNAWYEAAGFTPQQVHRVLQANASALAALPVMGSFVRAATAADRADAWDLHSALFTQSYLSAEAFGSSAARCALWVVPGDDGTIAGYLHAEDQPPGDEPYVDYLGVAPASRGRGFGAALLQRAGQGAVKRGRVHVALTVREDRPGALGLYLRCGFVEISAGRHWQGSNGRSAV